jgi:hypothetical protein
MARRASSSAISVRPRNPRAPVAVVVAETAAAPVVVAEAAVVAVAVAVVEAAAPAVERARKPS